MSSSQPPNNNSQPPPISQGLMASLSPASVFSSIVNFFSGAASTPPTPMPQPTTPVIICISNNVNNGANNALSNTMHFDLSNDNVNNGANNLLSNTMHFGLSNGNVVHESFVPCHDVMESSAHCMSHGAYGSMPTARPAHAGATTTPTQPPSQEPPSPGRKSSRTPVSPRRLADFVSGRPPPVVRRSHSQATEPMQPQPARAVTPVVTTAHTTSATTATPPRLRRHRSAPDITGSNAAVLSPPQLDGTGSKQAAYPPAYRTSLPAADCLFQDSPFMDALQAPASNVLSPSTGTHRTPTPPVSMPHPDHARGDVQPAPAASQAQWPASHCAACNLDFNSTNACTRHMTSMHMQGALVDVEALTKAGVPRCLRCCCFLVDVRADTHERVCAASYAAFPKKRILDALTKSCTAWLEIPEATVLSSLDQLDWPPLHCSWPSHAHLPRASQYRQALAVVLSRVARWADDPASRSTAFKLLQWMPRWLLTALPTARSPRAMDNLAASRLAMLLEGHYAALTQQYDLAIVQWLNLPARPDNDRRLAKVARLIDWGYLSDARQVLTAEAKVADLSDPVRAEATANKLDASAPPLAHRSSPEAQCTVEAWSNLCSDDDIAAIVRRKSKITSGGLSGLRPNHLAQLLQCNAAPALNTILRNMLLLPQDSVAWQHLSASALTPLEKGPTDVRPIAVQDTWTRLLAAVIWRKEGLRLAAELTLQFGTGRANGCGQVSALMQQMIDLDPDMTIIQADVANGYGALDRAHVQGILEARVSSAPFLFQYFNRLYCRRNTLYGRNNTEFHATRGVFQGDSLSPLLFCMAVDPAVKAANEAAGDGVATAYIDDNTIAVKSDRVAQTLAALQGQLAQSGLHLHPRKCYILQPRNGATVVSNQRSPIPVVEDGLTVLGAPVGSVEFRQQWAIRAVDTTVNTIALIQGLPSYQHRLLMVRFVVATLVTHIARCVPPSIFSTGADRHMEAIRMGLRDILSHQGAYDMHFPAAERADDHQLFTSLHTGGLGITDIATHAPSIFLAATRETASALLAAVGPRYEKIFWAWLDCDIPATTDLRRARGELMKLGDAAPVANPPLPEIQPKVPFRQLQHAYSAALEKHRVTLFLKSLRAATSATASGSEACVSAAAQLIRAMAVCEPAAMAYVNVLPRERRFRADNELYTLMLRRSLGMSLIPNGAGTALQCRKCSFRKRCVPLTSQHLAVCHREDISRHNAVRDIFMEMFRGIRVSTEIEPRTQNGSKRWDLAVTNLARDGCQRYYDFMVTDPTQIAYCRSNNPYPGGHLDPLYDDAVKLKLATYAEDLKSLRLNPRTSFTVLPFSSYGGASDSVLRVLNIVHTEAADLRCQASTWLTGSSYTAYFLAACSFAINHYTCISIRQSVGEALKLHRTSTAPPATVAPTLLAAAAAALPASFSSALPLPAVRAATLSQDTPTGITNCSTLCY